MGQKNSVKKNKIVEDYDEETRHRIDQWISVNHLNIFGDHAGSIYANGKTFPPELGEESFDQSKHGMQQRYRYIVSNHPSAPWKEMLPDEIKENGRYINPKVMEAKTKYLKEIDSAFYAAGFECPETVFPIIIDFAFLFSHFYDRLLDENSSQTDHDDQPNLKQYITHILDFPSSKLSASSFDFDDYENLLKLRISANSNCLRLQSSYFKNIKWEVIDLDLENLETLIVCNFNFSTRPSLLDFSESLRVINLDSTIIKGYPDSWEPIRFPPHLYSLDLTGTNYIGDFSYLKELKILRLFRNNSSKLDWSRCKFPPSLESLNIGMTNFSGSLAGLKLKDLDMTLCKLSDWEIDIPKTVERLNLSNTNFNKDLSEYTMLKRLTLDRWQVKSDNTVVNITMFPPNLEHLSLKRTKFLEAGISIYERGIDKKTTAVVFGPISRGVVDMYSHYEKKHFGIMTSTQFMQHEKRWPLTPTCSLPKA